MAFYVCISCSVNRITPTERIIILSVLETATRRFSIKKVLLTISQNSHDSTCARVSFLIKLQALGLSPFFNKVAGLRPTTLLKQETLTQALSCEFCESFENTFFYRKSLVAASVLFNCALETDMQNCNLAHPKP